jgi:hypothetical protein
MSVATCKVCASDFDIDSMIEDIEGAKYCLADSGSICVVCGVFDHDCEWEDNQRRELEWCEIELANIKAGLFSMYSQDYIEGAISVLRMTGEESK